MSREIKFRFWDTKEGKWLGKDSSYWKELTFKDCRDKLIASMRQGNIVAEQYTGLKDKNGKEIYEGDIVKGDMGVFEVKWYDLVAQFMFRPNMSMKYHPPFTSTQLEVMEVIGNIQENPELLEVKND